MNRAFKTFWEKEKMLLRSIFSFPKNFFRPFKDKLYGLIYGLLPTNAFKSDTSKRCDPELKFLLVLVDCIDEFNTVFIDILVTAWRPVHLPMLSWGSFYRRIFFPTYSRLLSHITRVKTMS